MAGLIVALVIVTAALAYSLYRLWHFRAEARRLAAQVDRFLADESGQPGFSVRDDAFAPLENGVVELENRLLQAAQLRSALQERSRQATADLSHQLKTPLSSLKLYTELDQGEHLPQQIALIERMEDLIAAVLRLERLEAGVYPFDFAPCQLHTLCQDQLEGFRPLYPGKHLTLAGEAELRCDRKWLGEAISNLIKNACEHTPPEGWVSVGISRGETAVSLTVMDNGGGVPEEEIGKLFRRFYRSSRARQGQGAGMGLAIVREIIRRHHGNITAENTPQGLKLSIVLPDLRPHLKES